MIHRYRINQLLQLQEMRNNIARDLHDDIGSTLGSIHLYSQIADKNSVRATLTIPETSWKNKELF